MSCSKWAYDPEKCDDVTKYYVCDFMDAQYEDDGYCHHGESEVEP